MKPIIPVFLVLSAAVAPAQKRFANPTWPAQPSIVSASAHIDLTEAELDRLLGSIRQADTAATKDAMHAYTEALSRLHVELGQLRIPKQERLFLNRTIDRLRLQATTLQTAETARPDLRTALEQAASHVGGALQMVEQQNTAKRRRWLVFRPWRQGPVPGYYGTALTQGGLRY